MGGTDHGPQLFPRGDQRPAVVFDLPARTASSFYYWSSRLIPHTVNKLYQAGDIPDWVIKVCGYIYFETFANILHIYRQLLNLAL